MCFAAMNPQSAQQFATAPGITSGIGRGFQAAAASRAGIPFSQIGQGGQQPRPSPQQQTQGGSLLGAPAASGGRRNRASRSPSFLSDPGR